MRRVSRQSYIPMVIAASLLLCQGSHAAAQYTSHRVTIDNRLGAHQVTNLALTDDKSPRAPLPEPPGGYPGFLYDTFTTGADIFQYVGKSAVNAVTLILSPLIYVGKILVGSMY